MLNTVNQYNKLKDSKNLVFAYKGNIAEELISSILDIIENKLGMVEYNSRLKKKIFNIIVELIQNVYHNYEENETIPSALNDIQLILVKQKNSYEIYCGNYLLKRDVTKLTNSIIEVNNMSEEDLRLQYRERLDNGVISNNGRAGLGIMDIVRKSNNQIEYAFTSYDEQFSLLSLKVNVNINK